MPATTWTAGIWSAAATPAGALSPSRSRRTSTPSTSRTPPLRPRCSTKVISCGAGLEDYLLVNAATYDRRLSVFTGPVLAETDPLYRGTRIPLRFWKITAFVDDGQLAATGYLLDQTPLVNLTDTAGPRTAGVPPPLGPFHTFQVPIADIAELTGLDLDTLPAADRLHMVAAAGADGRAPVRWMELTRFTDITF